MSSQTTQVRASCAFHAVFYSNSPPAVLGSAPPLSDSHPASPLQVGCSGMTSRSFSNNPHFVGFPGCSLLHGLTRWHWYVRNEASSCPGILSSTLRFYYVATSCLFPFLSSSLRVVLNRIPNRNRNRFCTSHTQCVTICDIRGGHKMSQFRICDLCYGFFLVFLAKQIWSCFGHKCYKFKCDWHKPFLVSIFKEMVRNEWNPAKQTFKLALLMLLPLFPFLCGIWIRTALWSDISRTFRRPFDRGSLVKVKHSIVRELSDI